MRVFHVSPAENNMSIDRLGLRVAFARGNPKRLWFVTREGLDWAIQHIKQRHHTDNVTVWYCRIPTKCLFRHSHSLLTCNDDVLSVAILGKLFRPE